MHILVRTITGLSCEVSDASTVSDVQSQVEKCLGVPAEEQKLLFNGSILSTEESLSSFGVKDQSEIALVVALEGGAKGKKKKKDTKKGKKKHHKKKVPLQVLKYYKVEDDKVVRLKQMCKVCPPGTFIAEHEDRLYCGRCHTVYTKVADEKKGKEAKGGKGGKKGKK